MDHFFQRHIYLKIFSILSIDLLIVLVALPLAYLIRTENFFLYIKNFDINIHILLCLSYIILFFFRNLHLESLRYFNVVAFFNYLILYIFVFIIFILYDFFVKKDYEVLRSIPVIFFFVAFGSSVLFRVMISRILTLKKNTLTNEKIFIYGASEQGVALSRFLSESKNLTTKNFIEDYNHKKQIIGIKIIGFNEFEQKYSNSNLKIYVSYERNTSDFHKAINKLNKYIKNVRIISSNEEGIKKEFRKLKLIDFFSRAEITNLSEDAVNKIQNNVIAITGGGGSIGGKLAEKVCQLSPKSLILIDFHEFSLVKIKNKLNEICKNNQNNTNIKTILLSLSDTKKLNNLFIENKIDILYHCAAYKHVDVSEDERNFNVFFENNYINSKRLILLCLKNKVKNFILVSTDKAVNPTNVMGSTKRLCEIYLLEIIKRLNINNYKIVRFGNVFRSSGSAIPLFEKQIQEKGEITITDPNVKRFFMSINEAGLLILESTVIKDKNLLILEMGEQIKILDIANLLIKINEYENIKIKYIGLKKGEKMEENLSNTPLEKTKNPSIFSSSEKIDKNTFAKLKKFERNYFGLDLKTKKIHLENIVKY